MCMLEVSCQASDKSIVKIIARASRTVNITRKRVITRKHKTYDDYVREGLFARFEDRMDVSKAKNSEEIIKQFGYFQGYKTSPKQAKLLTQYSKKHDIKVRPIYEIIHEKVREGKSAN
jgi:hypothetical protein